MPPHNKPDPPPSEPPSPAARHPTKQWVLSDDGKSYELEMRKHGLLAVITRKSTGAYSAKLLQGRPSQHPAKYGTLQFITHADSQDKAIEKLADAFETWATSRTDDILYAFMP